MKAKRIEVIKEWPEPKSVQDIQVFLSFANFYWQFIQGFSRIAALLTLMLKTATTTKRLTLEEVSVSEGGDSVDGGGVEIIRSQEN